MFFDFLKDINNYEARKIARTELEDNNGIGISTCYVSDERCWETALTDGQGTHPVERYQSIEEAKKGHEKWLTFTQREGELKIIKIGPSWCPEMNEEITLKRIPVCPS